MSAGWVYRATVRHARRERVAHAFNVPALYVQVDVDSAFVSGLFAIDRGRVLCVLTGDYLGGGQRPLRERLARWLPGIDAPDSDERVYLTTIPRVLGYAFNPLSVFLCVDRENRPRRALVEVKNTYGETHLYPLPEIDAHGRARAAKEFFVSPFFGIDGEYAFGFAPPGPRLGVSVSLQRHGETALDASVFGEGQPLGDGALALALAMRPLSALVAYPRIAWEALVLQYWKKVTPRMRPRARSERTVVTVAPRARA